MLLMAAIRLNKMIPIIDSHLHLFELSKGKYTWLKPENPPYWSDKPIICRDFSEQNLQVGESRQIEGFVHVEAGFDNEQPWREIEWLESTVTLPFKSIACIDLSFSPGQMIDCLNSLSQFESVVGVRHILDDDAESLLTTQHIAHHISAIERRGLIFELQMPLANPVAVNAMVELMNVYPNLRVAINHGGWPPAEHSSAADWGSWRQGLEQLSQFKHCVVKASGWEMVQRDYSIGWQENVLMALLEVFGTDRVLAASNFPLCLFSHNYETFWQRLSQVSPAKKKALFYDNAFHFYQF